ncbi:ATP-binding protein [Sporosarcina sp. PTS2304]|uniref:hybrid sensor histidine kinase/response regulator n=1 Tax=Sporosarcina sp. PTS2304 TaxID=2283194 RepID=UPI0013B465C0|nr:ATP-binding protein [Sporosarcina sp. PTS2304]
MATFTKKWRRGLMIVVVLLFALLLTGFRLQWIKTFNETGENPIIERGVLDLREWDFSDKNVISLNGEWGFFPYEHITTASLASDGVAERYIHTPGDWSEVLNPENQSPYGYGSYHLRILVTPDQDQTYGIQVPSVRSSSALYINGLFSGRSGEVADNKEDAHALNVPYSSSSIRADEEGVIEIILQATNFEDPRSSGLVRSIKFGYEENTLADVKLSTLLQVITAIIFFVHALFACILFIIGIRNRRLLYFALMLIASSISNIMGGDEKILLQYIEMNYTGSFKLSFSLLIIFGLAMVHCVKPQIQSLFKPLLPIYTVASIGIIVVVMILPLESLDFASTVSLSYVILSAAITALALLISKKEYSGGIWLALSSVALASHIGWWAYSLNTGLKVVYYPFDLIIAVICFAGVWFKQYHQMHLDTNQFAEELQRADKVKDEFLANTSHELRNPLHSILNMSVAILEREQSALQGRSVKDLEAVISVSRRMSVMVNELLDMTHLKEGNPKLEPGPCSLQAVTVGVIDMLEYMVEGKPVQMVNKIPNDFPLIVADEKRLTQIVFNLLHNAIKFTNHGEITIQTFIQEGKAQISISDTGIGMEKEVLKNIFEPYVQGRNREDGGFGLGLNISQKLVMLHGSILQVHSVLDEGSTFSFQIPLAHSEAISNMHSQIQSSMEFSDESDMKKTHLEESIVEEHVAVDLERPRILVVDDDPINLQVIDTILAAEKYNVKTVLNGIEALILLDKKEWDLVISDVMMPHMSGYDLTKQIRERFSIMELPILLLTARSQPKDIENGFLAGANDYVQKPIDALEFKSRVRALTNVKQSMQEKLQIEAAWLQAQIRPHFLFNALNTIMALSEIDLERMQKVLGAFSQLLRGKFKFTNLNELVPLEDELELIQAYLLIEKERFVDRLHVIWEKDEDLAVVIPSLTIQPLVENAIHHGIMKRPEGGRLTIRISQVDTHIEISVEDDGVGMEKSEVAGILKKTASRNTGIGLLNTDLRLIRQFGHGLKIESVKDVGTKVSFIVPRNMK